MRTLTAFLMAALIGGLALGQGVYGPLDLGLGVRAEGFGGAYTALAQGPDALLYNPAGLAEATGIEVNSSYLNAMGLYSVTWIGGAVRGLGAGLAYLSAGGIESPGGSSLAFSHLTLIAGGGLPASALPFLRGFLPPGLSLGLNLKYDHATLASSGAGGVTFDFGLLSATDLPFGRLLLGATLFNLGGALGLGEEPDSWSFSGSLGAALLTPYGLIVSFDFSNVKIALGLGWDFGHGIELRAGFRSQGGVGAFSLGLGVRWQGFTLDYAATTHPVLGLSHRLALAVSFGG